MISHRLCLCLPVPGGKGTAGPNRPPPSPLPTGTRVGGRIQRRPGDRRKQEAEGLEGFVGQRKGDLVPGRAARPTRDVPRSWGRRLGRGAGRGWVEAGAGSRWKEGGGWVTRGLGPLTGGIGTAAGKRSPGCIGSADHDRPGPRTISHARATPGVVAATPPTRSVSFLIPLPPPQSPICAPPPHPVSPPSPGTPEVGWLG